MNDLEERLRIYSSKLMAVEARIAALEAALREIMEHPAGLYEDQYDIAHAALAEEQDK